MQIRDNFSAINTCRPSRKPKAFTLIGLLAVIAVIVLLACIVILSLAQHRRAAKVGACRDNLKQIGVAFRTWALDCGDAYPSRVTISNGGAKEQLEMGQVFFNFLVMSNEIGTPKILVCPEDAGRVAVANFNPGFSNTNVSFFVGVDAADTFPQMFLTGDRNLAFEGQPLAPGLFLVASNRTALSWTKAIHNLRGNIGLADGSVQTLDSRQLALAATLQSCDTNQLAIP